MLSIFRNKKSESGKIHQNSGSENREAKIDTAKLSPAVKKIAVPAGNGRRLTGTVVSDKMKKTVVIAVSKAKKHPKYLKYFTVTSRLKAHDENNEYHVGDKVIIQEVRPLSKDKRWVVVGKAQGANRSSQRFALSD